MNEVKKEALQAPAMPTITPSISDQYKSGKSVYDIFKNYGRSTIMRMKSKRLRLIERAH